MMDLFTMRKGRMEADDDYLNRFNPRLHNTEFLEENIRYVPPN